MQPRDGLIGSTYSRGETIFRQGEVCDCMYVVQSRSVEVSGCKDGQEFIIAIHGKGDFFGEMALIANTPRSATVSALEAAELIAIDKTRFLASIHENPELAIAVINTLMARLAYLNKVMADPTCV